MGAVVSGIRPWLSFYEPGRNRLLALSAAGFAVVLLVGAAVLGPVILRDVGEHRAWARAVAIGMEACEGISHDADQFELTILNTDVGTFDWMGNGWNGDDFNLAAAQKAVADRLKVVEQYRDAAERRRRRALDSIRGLGLRPQIQARYLAAVDQNLYRQARAYGRLLADQAAILTAYRDLLALMARRPGQWSIEGGSPVFHNRADFDAAYAFNAKVYEAQRRSAGWAESLRTRRVFDVSPP